MTAVVQVHNLIKNYQALRPLRLASMTVEPGAVMAVMGLDAPAAEMLVGVLTGAVLPDEGEVQLFGQSTTAVSDSDAWLAMLDRVGIVTERAVLIAQFTVEQNLAMPFTLQVDPVAEERRPQLRALAEEVGLAAADLTRRVAESPAAVVTRVRLARALALEPQLLIAEHPSAVLPRDDVKRFAADVARVARTRSLAVLALTGDEAFASALGGVVLTHDAASGALKPRSAWRKLWG